MKCIGLLSAAAGIIMFGLSGAASAAPIGTSLPNLSTLAATEGNVEQVQYWRHRRCHWVRYGHRWHRRCNY